MNTRDYLLPVSVVVLAGAILAGLGDVANAVRIQGSEMLGLGGILVVVATLVFGWLLWTSIRERSAKEESEEEDGDQKER